MRIHKIKQGLYWIATIAVFLLPALLAAALYWAGLDANIDENFANWIQTNAWWIAVIAALLALFRATGSRPFTDDQIRLQLAAMRQIVYSCSDWQHRYLSQHTQKSFSEVFPEGSRNFWDDIKGLPDLPYSTANWRRMQPMFGVELDRVINVMQDVLVAFPELLPIELRERIIVARSRFENARNNFNIDYDLLATPEIKNAVFAGYVRGAIKPMKMVCCEAQLTLQRWRNAGIDRAIDGVSSNDKS